MKHRANEIPDAISRTKELYVEKKRGIHHLNKQHISKHSNIIMSPPKVIST